MAPFQFEPQFSLWDKLLWEHNVYRKFTKELYLAAQKNINCLNLGNGPTLWGLKKALEESAPTSNREGP